MTKESLFKYLPLRLSTAINSLPEPIIGSLSEIRIRKNSIVSLTVGNKNLTLDKNGKIVDLNSGLITTDDEFEYILSRLTQGSLYACDEYLKKGFIPLEDGGRAGVCGRTSVLGGFAEITSLSLRLSRFLPDVASGLIEKYREEGVSGALICSPPAMGKTTFLKSVAFLLSSGIGIPACRVAIADERVELSSGLKNHGFLDILSGIDKASAIEMLTRTMSPEVIICDEISASEVDAVFEAQSSGVALIASAHCKSVGELMHRGRMKRLLEGDVFRLCVTLGYDDGYTVKIGRTEELL